MSGPLEFEGFPVEELRPGIERLPAGVGLAALTGGHAAEEFDAAFALGRDPGSGARWFRGSLDDVRIYRFALTPGEIEALAAAHP